MRFTTMLSMIDPSFYVPLARAAEEAVRFAAGKSGGNSPC